MRRLRTTRRLRIITRRHRTTTLRLRIITPRRRTITLRLRTTPLRLRRAEVRRRRAEVRRRIARRQAVHRRRVARQRIARLRAAHRRPRPLAAAQRKLRRLVAEPEPVLRRPELQRQAVELGLALLRQAVEQEPVRPQAAEQELVLRPAAEQRSRPWVVARLIPRRRLVRRPPRHLERSSSFIRTIREGASALSLFFGRAKVVISFGAIGSECQRSTKSE